MARPSWWPLAHIFMFCLAITARDLYASGMTGSNADAIAGPHLEKGVAPPKVGIPKALQMSKKKHGSKISSPKKVPNAEKVRPAVASGKPKPITESKKGTNVALDASVWWNETVPQVSSCGLSSERRLI